MPKTSYKKKNNNRKRAKRGRKGRKRYPTIPQFRNLAPNSLMLRDTFQSQIKLVPLGTVAGMSGLPHVALFKCSSGYDIFKPVNSSRESWLQLSGTIGNLQSLINTNAAPRRLYSHYYVMGSKITATFQPTSNIQTNPEENNVQVACGITRDALWPTASAAAGTSLHEITQARNSASRQMIGNSNYGKVGNRAKMWASYSPKDILGITDTTDNDELKVSVVDGDATENTYFYVYLNGLNKATALDPTQIPNYLINVKIDYLLKFVEPLDNHNEAIGSNFT